MYFLIYWQHTSCMCVKKNKKYVGKCIIEVNEKVKSQFFSLSLTLSFYRRSINTQISHDIVKVVVFLLFFTDTSVDSGIFEYFIANVQ
jgi:hypothetical protein